MIKYSFAFFIAAGLKSPPSEGGIYVERARERTAA
jgi:hypothetical protein